MKKNYSFKVFLKYSNILLQVSLYSPWRKSCLPGKFTYRVTVDIILYDNIE
jgi:hypothetical protein